MHVRFEVVLEPHINGSKHHPVITTDTITLVDNRKIQEPVEFKDVAYAELVAKLLNNYYKKS